MCQLFVLIFYDRKLFIILHLEGCTPSPLFSFCPRNPEQNKPVPIYEDLDEIGDMYMDDNMPNVHFTYMGNTTASFRKAVSPEINQDGLSDIIAMMMVRSKKIETAPSQWPPHLNKIRSSNIMEQDEYPDEDMEFFLPKI